MHIYTSLIFHGDQLGRTIGFPTLNLDPTCLSTPIKLGVWQAQVTIKGDVYTGALYFGPRTIKNETTQVLEIYLLDFDEEVYGEQASFSLVSFVRPVIHFASLADLQKQLAADVLAIRQNHSV